MKLKTKAALIICCAMIFVVLSACSGGTADKPAKPTESTKETSDVTTPQPTETEKDTEEPEITAEPEVTETVKPEATAVDDIMVVDANLYDTKENPVPLGQWVYYQAKNYASGEYEPFYVRLVSVSRDKAEVQATLDAYDGNYDLSLTEDQARDVEYGILEYEIYFALDYEAGNSGIKMPSVSLAASPIAEGMFKTDGGTTYIGIGRTYGLNINGSGFYPQPGDTVHEKTLFSMLKDYDESEYLFILNWNEGEISTEKSRNLYLALTK